MDSLLKKAGMPGKTAGGSVTVWRQISRQVRSSGRRLRAFDELGRDRDERRMLTLGDVGVRARRSGCGDGGAALQAGPILVQLFSGQAAVRVVFALGTA